MTRPTADNIDREELKEQIVLAFNEVSRDRLRLVLVRKKTSTSDQGGDDDEGEIKAEVKSGISGGGQSATKDTVFDDVLLEEEDADQLVDAVTGILRNDPGKKK